MKNRKISVILLVLLAFNTNIFGQDPVAADAQPATADAQPVADQNPIAPDAAPEDTGNLPIIESDENAEAIGNPRVADEKLTTVLIDNFEIPQGWIASIPVDFGISKILYRPGAASELSSDTNKTVLGVKTVFFRRNYGWMSIDRPYPLSLKNYVRSFTVWISGRSRRHVFAIKVRDVDYNRLRLTGGDMRFQGWKKIIVPVSDTVVQYNPIRNNRGLDFLGFHIDFLAEDTSTLEPYYLYFDQFTADMNMTATQASDDVNDDW